MKGFDNTLKKALLFSLLGFTLAGCGSKLQTRAANTNVITSGSDWSSTVADGVAGAECVGFDSTKVRLSGKVTTYYFSGKIQEDRVRVRLTGLPANFESSSGTHIKFFRWKANGDGYTEIDATPLNIIIEAGSPARPISGVLTSLSQADVNSFKSLVGVSGGAQDFFNQVSITVTGTDYNWQALKVVVYDDTTTVGDVDLLLPIFAANPNTYASTHPAALNAYHPFWAQRGQTSMTDNDWVNRSKSACF